MLAILCWQNFSCIALKTKYAIVEISTANDTKTASSKKETINIFEEIEKFVIEIGKFLSL